MSRVELEWRLRRLSQMSATEVGWRVSDHVRRRRWASRQITPRAPPPSWALRTSRHTKAPWDPVRYPAFRAFSSEELLRAVPDEARRRVIAAGQEVLAGRWELLGSVRWDMEDPDWFIDPVTGRRAPQVDYCFKVNHRSEEVTGNVKQIWELSRMHHLTVLAAAFALTGDERYAERAASHLRSWWTQNPFLSGVHWTSGIETGLRLIAWVWVRRLLDSWVGVTDLFEANDVALAQIWWHQHYLASFRSRGSSANNHVIAEAAGLLVAALAFDWFAESSRWSEEAIGVLEQELATNTFPSGVNREMAFEYHGFVTELAVVSAVEADWAGRPLSSDTWALLYRMLNVIAATVDVSLRGPRQGDGDDGKALVLDPPTAERWPGLLAIGEGLFDAPGWWPSVEPTVSSTLLTSMAGGRRTDGYPERRQCHYSDAGLTLMRSSPSEGEEIWCRCDAGPHGFLSIAAHAHADALGRGGAPRRHGCAGGPRDVLLSRRAPLAQLLSLDSCSQHDRSRPPGPVNVGWPLPVDSSRAEQPVRAGDQCNRGGHTLVRPARRLRDPDPARPPPPVGAVDEPGSADRDSRLPGNDREACLPVGIPLWARHPGPLGRKHDRAHLVEWRVHAKRHTLPARRPHVVTHKRWNRPGPRLVLLALRREAADLGGRWRGRVQRDRQRHIGDRAPVRFGWRARLNR